MHADCCIFDASDIDALLTMADGESTVLRFTPAELRHQIHAAEVESSVCRTFGEDAWAFVYADLADAMRIASDILLSTQRKPAPRPGHDSIDMQAIKSRADILNVAERYTKLHKSGARFSGKCPLHDSKGSPLTIYPENQSWYCFHCDKGGDVLDMVMLFERMGFREAAGVLE